MNYFITGGTGFIGRFLIERLLRRDGTVYVMVRKGSRGKLEEMIAGWGAPEGKIIPIVGDLTAPNMGLSKTDRKTLHGVDHCFHLAAVYDLTANAKTNSQINVEGTRNAVALANDLNVGCFHHVSSIAVAGQYRGRFSESMFDEGQKFDNPYFRTKFEAEKIVREQLQVPYKIYRPGAVVGDSVTGEMDKIDGPYYFFGALKKLGEHLPGWLPLVGIQGGKINIVPVDFVADAIDAIAHREDLTERVFHLTDPNALAVGEVLNAFAGAAGAPRFLVRIDNPVTRLLPRVAREALHVPGATLTVGQLLKPLGIPAEVLAFIDYPTTFDSRNTQAALSETHISVPPLRSYAERLWRYWDRHLDPSPTHNLPLRQSVAGKVVVVTGASSGIGESVAMQLGDAGAKVLLIARSVDQLERVRTEIDSNGGSAAVHPADLSDPDDCDRVVAEILEQHGRVDILVNNAGRSIRRSVINSTDRYHDFERTMSINYYGAVKLILGFLPGMMERHSGHIVNISSIGAQTNAPRFSAYIASKSALDAFSRCLATEVIGDGIHVTTVYMPLVRTPMIAPTTIYKAFPAITPEEAANLVSKAIIKQPKKVATPLGNLGELSYAVAPKLVDHVLNRGFRLFPESAAAKGKTSEPDSQVSGEGVAFAYLMRGIHW